MERQNLILLRGLGGRFSEEDSLEVHTCTNAQHLRIECNRSYNLM